MDENKRGKISEIKTDNNNNGFISLPYEILLFVFQFLDPLDIFRYVSKVNKLFNTISKDNQLLNNIIKNEKLSLQNIPLKLRPEDTSPFKLYKITTQIKIKMRQVLQKIFSSNVIEYDKPVLFSIDDLNEIQLEQFENETLDDFQKRIKKSNHDASERIWPVDVLEYLRACNFISFKEELEFIFFIFGYKSMKQLQRESYFPTNQRVRLFTKSNLIIQIGEAWAGTDSEHRIYVSLEPEKYGYCFYYSHDDKELYFIATSMLALLQNFEEILSSELDTSNPAYYEDSIINNFFVPLHLT